MGLLSTISSILSAAIFTFAGPGSIAPPTTAPPAPAVVSVWPLQPPTVVRAFSPPDRTWAAGHRGVDLGGTPGAAVLASVAGTVTFAGLLAGRDVVVISQGDTRMTYEPVIPAVKVGEVVGTGATIGILDTTQSHCFPLACLHWGYLRGETYLNPLDLLAPAPPVRLLPLMPSDGPGGTPS